MKSSRTRIFAVNSLSTAVYQSTLIIAALVIPSILIKNYGSEVNGLITSLTQFISYFNLVEAGISGAAIYMLYAPLAAGDWKYVSKIVVSARNYYYKSGAVFILLMLVLILVYPNLTITSNFDPIRIRILTVILGTKGVLEFFTLAKFRVLLTADQKLWVVQLSSAFYQLINTFIIYFLAINNTDIIVVYIFSAFAIYIRTAILIIYTKITYKELNITSQKSEVVLDQRWDALYLQLLGAVQQGTPIIVATLLLQDLTLVSIFSIYLLLSNGLAQIGSFLSSGLQASFGDLIARNENHLLAKVYQEYEVLFYSFIAILSGCGFILIMPFVEIYTSDFSDASYISFILGMLAVANMLTNHLKTPQGLMVIAAGKYRETRLQTTIQALIMIVATTLLAYLYGLTGVFMGMIISHLYRIVDLSVFVPCRITRTKISNTYRNIVICLLQILIIILPWVFFRPQIVSLQHLLIWGGALLAYSIFIVILINYIFSRDSYYALRTRAIQLFRSIRDMK